MSLRSRVSATGSLVIVEQGAVVPAEIFTEQSSSNHALIQQSQGESMRNVLRRAERRLLEFAASQVRLTTIVVVISEAASEADMLTRELLARSLLRLKRAANTALTFVAGTSDELLSTKLLQLVGKLIEGTRDRSVTMVLGTGRFTPITLPATAA